MQLDSQGLQAQQAAETARREAGKLGMRVLQQQMQVRTAPVRMTCMHAGQGTCFKPCMFL
jgi:hypothetical protein